MTIKVSTYLVYPFLVSWVLLGLYFVRGLFVCCSYLIRIYANKVRTTYEQCTNEVRTNYGLGITHVEAEHFPSILKMRFYKSINSRNEKEKNHLFHNLKNVNNSLSLE